MKLKTIFAVEPNTKLFSFYEQMFQNLIENSCLTIDQAFCLALDYMISVTAEQMIIPRMLSENRMKTNGRIHHQIH